MQIIPKNIIPVYQKLTNNKFFKQQIWCNLNLMNIMSWWFKKSLYWYGARTEVLLYQNLRLQNTPRTIYLFACGLTVSKNALKNCSSINEYGYLSNLKRRALLQTTVFVPPHNCASYPLGANVSSVNQTVSRKVLLTQFRSEWLPWIPIW